MRACSLRHMRYPFRQQLAFLCRARPVEWDFSRCRFRRPPPLRRTRARRNWRSIPTPSQSAKLASEIRNPTRHQSSGERRPHSKARLSLCLSESSQHSDWRSTCTSSAASSAGMPVAVGGQNGGHCAGCGLRKLNFRLATLEKGPVCRRPRLGRLPYLMAFTLTVPLTRPTQPDDQESGARLLRFRTSFRSSRTTPLLTEVFHTAHQCGPPGGFSRCKCRLRNCWPRSTPPPDRLHPR